MTLTPVELREGADAALDLAANRSQLVLDAAIELATLLSSGTRSTKRVTSTPPARDAIADLLRHTQRIAELLALATETEQEADAAEAASEACGGCGEELANMIDGGHLTEANAWRCCDCLLVVTRLACDGLTFCEACGQAHGGLPHSRD